MHTFTSRARKPGKLARLFGLLGASAALAFGPSAAQAEALPDFTTLVEQRSPDEIIELLNTYYTLMFAAINGHGKYFSANEPKEVVEGLSDALATLQGSFGQVPQALGNWKHSIDLESAIEPRDAFNAALIDQVFYTPPV